MRHIWVAPKNSKRYDVDIKGISVIGLDMTMHEVALLSSILNNQNFDFSIKHNRLFDHDTILYQLLPVKSGTIRENEFDIPYAPAKILLDDINHLIITQSWDARDGMFPIMHKISNVSVKEYAESHHTT